jgi:hypothetical protein
VPKGPKVLFFVMKCALFVQANVAVNSILKSKVPFLFSEHIYVCPFTQATILEKTLGTIPASITKVLNVYKTNFVSLSAQFNVVKNAEITFGNIP